MSKKILYAIFDDDEVLLKSVKELRSKGIEITEVYSPFPVHGLDHALGLKETRMAITAFIYGCLGLAFGGLLIYYIMISGVGKSWPMILVENQIGLFTKICLLLFQLCLSVLFFLLVI
jgi:hypothetical protein